jgi:acetoacetyl-CoA synthetase
LNRGGVRMGTSEFYSVVEEFPEVADSLVVDTSTLGAEGQLLLFLVMREGASLDEDMASRIKDRIRSALSPRHVPNDVLAAPAVPRTLNGKKVEVPVKRILQGETLQNVAAEASMSNPEAMAYFVGLAGELGRGQPVPGRRDVIDV